MTSSGPIQFVALKPVSCGWTVWRRGGARQITVAVKATFGLIPDGTVRLVAPAPLVLEDTYTSPSGSLAEPTDLAPYLPGAGVILWAHAHPPQPAPAMTVRLAVFRDRALVDKSVHVFGDRSEGAPRPFQDIPITYERAYGGAGVADNPAGSADPRSPPNVVHPADPRRPAGFGPIAKQWGSRRRLLGAVDPQAVERPDEGLPDGLDFRYFHAAPADQQCDFLRGDEWIVLDGVHPTLARVQTRLPQVQAHARWVPPGASRPADAHPLSLSADTLLIDAERRVCSMVWRGSFAIEQADAMPRIVVFAGIEMPGYPIAWPDTMPPPEPTPSAPALSRPAPPPSHPGPPVQAVDFDDELSTVQNAAGVPRVAAPEPERLMTEKVAPVRAALPALPFAPPSPSDPGPHFAAPPFVPKPATMGTTAPEGATSPFAAGLPFKVSAPSSVPRAAPPPGMALPFKGVPSALPFKAPPPPVAPGALPFSAPAAPGGLPFKAPEPARLAAPPGSTEDDEEGHTRTFDVAEMEAQRRKFAAPFAIAQPGQKAQGPVAEIPGAPWSPGARVAMEPPRAPHPLSVTAVPVPPPDVAMFPPPAMVAPPAMFAPPAMAAPSAEPAMFAPPAMMAAPSAEPAMLALPPVVAPPPSVAEPASAASSPLASPPAAAELPPAQPSSPGLADTDPRAILRASVAARLAAHEPLLDMSLAGADLHDLDFSGAVLPRINLRGARLVGCKLVGARLAGAQLGEADLSGADLSGADLSGADLSRATLGRAKLDGAILTEANLSSAQGPGASFTGASAARAAFARGAWEGATFARADAAGADFTAASLGGARFDGASLLEVHLTDARGPGAAFDEARLSQARAVGASFPGASFRGVDASGSVWEKATLDEASFAGAHMKDVNLSRASCLKTSFAGADLAGANLQRLTGDGADLTEAVLSGADLRQARLRDARFERATLRDLSAGKADLAGGRFDGANLGGSTLRGARLTGASLVRADLEGVDLRDAELDGANVFGASRKTAKLGAGAKGLVEVDPATRS